MRVTCHCSYITRREKIQRNCKLQIHPLNTSCIKWAEFGGNCPFSKAEPTRRHSWLHVCRLYVSLVDRYAWPLHPGCCSRVFEIIQFGWWNACPIVVIHPIVIICPIVVIFSIVIICSIVVCPIVLIYPIVIIYRGWSCRYPFLYLYVKFVIICTELMLSDQIPPFSAILNDKRTVGHISIPKHHTSKGGVFFSSVFSNFDESVGINITWARGFGSSWCANVDLDVRIRWFCFGPFVPGNSRWVNLAQ